ncbi:hypothetical protein [Arthrobacter sp. StoSoilB13]|uniref:hypothetical protein n=1 Tax=Arthrobacter sp. StoSoilB13 TaxID=2830993 RepID=UPI001CC69B25|nr:hypothetical protein [Arthrobacter sp. StoSoilB13]BCW47980.1 hypothetical protein StoSoilB13_03220 [Arthrobacter sp. StoSoilB13]
MARSTPKLARSALDLMDVREIRKYPSDFAENWMSDKESQAPVRALLEAKSDSSFLATLVESASALLADIGVSGEGLARTVSFEVLANPSVAFQRKVGKDTLIRQAVVFGP